MTPVAQLRKMYPDIFYITAPRPAPILAEETFTPFDPAGDDFTFRERYRGRFDPVRCATPILARNYGIYRRLLRRSRFADVIQEQRLDEVFACENWKEICGWLSDKAKKEQVAFSKHWRTLVDLATFNGYAQVSDDEFEEQVKDWVTVVRKHTVDGSEEQFNDMFQFELTNWLAERIKTVDVKLTIDDFSQDPTLWAKPGSSFDTHGTRLVVEYAGKQYKPSKTKWMSALKLSPEEVRKRILSPAAQVGKAVKKRETKKARAVISIDLDTYLKMAYVSAAWLDEALAGAPDSTLFMDGEQLQTLWASFMSGNDVSVPLDQSAFDHNVNRRMVGMSIDGLTDALSRTANDLGGKQDCLDVMALLKYSMLHGYVIVGSRHFPYKNGVLSGWRWTALLDTIVNIVEMRMARALVMREWKEDPIKWFNAQGDDDLVRVRHESYGVALYLAYVHMGFVINPQKFFIRRDTDEYLRRVADKANKAMYGYPARAVNAITNRNPINEPDRPGAERLNDTLSRWNTLCARLDIDDVPPEAIEDLMGGNRLSREEVTAWLHTPLAAGGGGIKVAFGPGYGATAARRIWHPYTLDKAKGLAAVGARARAVGLTVTPQMEATFAQTVLKFNPKVASKLSEWESGELIPVRMDYVIVNASGHFTFPRQPDDWTRAYGAFPTEENADTMPIKPSAGVARWWWLEGTTGTLSGPSFRVFGRSWDWLSWYAQRRMPALQSWFRHRRASDRGLWDSARASVAYDVEQRGRWREFDVRV